ncbi:MAG: hypothetical protein ABIA04_11365 [Pseudomonadota bacterium]
MKKIFATCYIILILFFANLWADEDGKESLTNEELLIVQNLDILLNYDLLKEYLMAENFDLIFLDLIEENDENLGDFNE